MFVIPMFVTFLQSHVIANIWNGSVSMVTSARAVTFVMFILFRAVSTSNYLVSNVTNISAKLSEGDVEGNGCDVIQHVTQLVWRNWENQWRPQSGKQVKRLKGRDLHIQCRMILKLIFMEKRIDRVRLVLLWLLTRTSGGLSLAQNEPSIFIKNARTIRFLAGQRLQRSS